MSTHTRTHAQEIRMQHTRGPNHQNKCVNIWFLYTMTIVLGVPACFQGYHSRSGTNETRGSNMEGSGFYQWPVNKQLPMENVIPKEIV